MLDHRKACWCMQYFCFIWKSHVQHPPPCASAGGTPTCHIEVKAPTYIRSGCTDLRASSSHRPWAEGSSLYVGIRESMQIFCVLPVWCLFLSLLVIPLQSLNSIFESFPLLPAFSKIGWKSGKRCEYCEQVFTGVHSVFCCGIYVFIEIFLKF